MRQCRFTKFFCQVTGYGGTTQRAEDAAVGIIDREMGVRFTASVDAALPIEVKPAAMSVDKVGSKVTVVYTATNLSDKPVGTTAGFNVAPAIADHISTRLSVFASPSRHWRQVKLRKCRLSII